MTEQFANNAATTLSAAIESTDGTSISVTSAAGFPESGNFRILVDDEIMLVTAVDGTTWTVMRGAESTTGATHSSGAAVTHVLTAGAIGTLQTPDASVVTYTPATATDWDSDTDPGNADDALDQLAERVDDLETATRSGVIGFTIDGGGSAITTGLKGYVPVPEGCTITAARIVADQSGSCVVDIWADSFANFPPTDADSITSATPPTLASAQTAEDTTLASWTTSLSAGDWLAFNVDSAATVTRVVVALFVEY